VPRPESEREDRTFECRECGLPRTYTIQLKRSKSTPRASGAFPI
jgi:hypothetical protein